MYHCVFAPHSRWRAEVTPAGRVKVKVIASIEVPAAIGKILRHLESCVPPTWSRPALHKCRVNMGIH